MQVFGFDGIQLGTSGARTDATFLPHRARRGFDWRFVILGTSRQCLPEVLVAIRSVENRERVGVALFPVG